MVGGDLVGRHVRSRRPARGGHVDQLHALTGIHEPVPDELQLRALGVEGPDDQDRRLALRREGTQRLAGRCTPAARPGQGRFRRLEARDRHRLRPARRRRGIRHPHPARPVARDEPDRRRVGGVRSAGVVRHRPVPAVAADAEEALLEIPIGGERRRVHDPVDAAVDHDRDVLRHRGGHSDVLLDDEDRDLPLLADPDQHVLDLLHDDRRESLGRLVHHQQARVEQQRARDREHLLLAARELAAAARMPFLESRKRVVDALARPPAAGAALAQPQVLVHGERRPQAPSLGDVPDAVVRDPARTQACQLVAFELDGSARDRHEPHESVAQGGLAHPVAADDGDDPVREIEVDPLQRVGLAVVHVQPPDAKRCRFFAPPRPLSHGRLAEVSESRSASGRMPASRSAQPWPPPR